MYSVLVLLFSTLCPPSFAIILRGKRELAALLQLSSWCLVTVSQCSVALPRSALGWYGVCDCGIS